MTHPFPAGFTIIQKESTGSTNDDVCALAREGATKAAVIAGEQTGGRGRLGRSWSSPQGGMYLSALFYPQHYNEDSSAFSLSAALAVGDALEHFGVAAKLKWPNDVGVEHDGQFKKIAGILLQSHQQSGSAFLVVGIGLNVAAPKKRVEHAAYLHDLLAEAGATDLPDVSEVAAVVLTMLDRYIDLWDAEGFTEAARARYDARNILVGQHVAVRNQKGETLQEGEVRGIDAKGRLHLRYNGISYFVSSGEVTLRDPHKK